MKQNTRKLSINFSLFKVMATIAIAAVMAFGAPAQIGSSSTYWELADGVLTISGTGPMPTNFTSAGANNPWYSQRASITSVVIEDGVTTIGDYAFRGCTGLTSISIPNSVTSIGQYAFRDCTGLTSVTIPASVTTIGSWAFENCTGLTSVTIPNSVTSIGNLAFSGCTGLTAINVEESNANYASAGGVLFNKVKTTLIKYPAGKTGAYTIPNSVTSIEGGAFYKCTGLTSVTIPNSVTSIGSQAFDGCTGLTSISIPASVTSIESYAFRGCTGLKHIVNGAATPQAISTSSQFSEVTLADVNLFVPASAIDDYRAANVWKDFKDIVSFSVAKPTFTPTPSLVYTGDEQLGGVIAEGLQYEISGIKGTTAGIYTAKAVLLSGCKWSDGSTNDFTTEWTIATAPITKPTAPTNLVYTSAEQTAIAETADYTVTDGKGTAANSYTATIALKDKINYQWADCTTDCTADLTLTWAIAKATAATPTGITATAGQTLADVSLAAHSGWSWATPTADVGTAGTQTHKANYTPTDAVNYNPLTNIDVSIEVKAAEDTDPIRRQQVANGNFRIQSVGNYILLENLPSNAKVEVYNLQGKRIYSAHPENPQILTIKVQTKGMYIVKIK